MWEKSLHFAWGARSPAAAWSGSYNGLDTQRFSSMWPKLSQGWGGALQGGSVRANSLGQREDTMTNTTRYLASCMFIIPLALGLSLGEVSARSYVELTADDVKAVISQGSEKVGQCYRRHAKKQKQADGKVALHLVVTASGKVAEVEVEAPSIRGKKFERCVTEVAKRWHFPKASGGTDVTYPFLFVHGTRHARHSRSSRSR